MKPKLSLSRSALLGCVAALGLAQAPARADIGTLDAVPAATLLLPYFEVDLDDPSGVTTFLTINNASATAVLAHVTLWTDLAVPTHNFNIYLTGYDQHSVDLGCLFREGCPPQSASDGQDPADRISPQGQNSQDINFASCVNSSVQTDPNDPNSPFVLDPNDFRGLPSQKLTPAFLAGLQAAHTGQASSILGNQCGGVSYGDSIARGYITLDTVNNCTGRFAGDAGYFGAGGSGDVTNQNVIMGDYSIVNPGQNFAFGDRLVHIEASATDPETSVPGEYTFYGRYVSWTADDNREPLATTFMQRFANGGVTSAVSELVVWRDPKVDQGPFTCPVIPGVRPNWYPLNQEQAVVFDEEENPALIFDVDDPNDPNDTTGPFVPFAAATQRVSTEDFEGFPNPFQFGFLFANLNTFVTPAGQVPPEDASAAQAFILGIHSSEGRFQAGWGALILDSAANATHFLLPLGGQLPALPSATSSQEGGQR